MRATTAVLLAASVLTSASCHQREPAAPQGTAVNPQQLLVERAAEVVRAMRSNPKFAALDPYLADAKGVMIFPRLIKAGLVLGGEGGNGVLVTRAADGSFSAPAFYAIGGGSVGLQLGYQETSLILVLMTDAALRSAIDRAVTLGTDVSVAAGTLGDSSQARRTGASRDIYYFADVRGVFAGLSLDGAVLGARPSQNTAYYGPEATTYGIVLEHRFDNPGAAVLKDALK